MHAVQSWASTPLEHWGVAGHAPAIAVVFGGAGVQPELFQLSRCVVFSATIGCQGYFAELGQQLLTKYVELHRTVFNHLYFRAGPDMEPPAAAAAVVDSRALLPRFLRAVSHAQAGRAGRLRMRITISRCI